MKIYDLQVNHLNNPVGISGENLRLNWKVDDCKKQTAYQVLVYQVSLDLYAGHQDQIDVDALKKKGAKPLFDSDKIYGGQTYYKLPLSLDYRCRYIVKLVTWDQDDNTAESHIVIITGTDKSHWQAKWINPEGDIDPNVRQRAAYLHKTFNISAAEYDQVIVNGAYIYATAHGIMNIYINGREITDHQLMPGTQQYDKRLMVETLPVGEFLQEGENEIMVTLGDGWYRGSMGHSQDKNVYGTDIAFLGQLEIAGSNGGNADSQILLISDETWQASSNGPLGLNDFMGGEVYDARKQIDYWHEVIIEGFGYDNLICVDTVPILPFETFEPKWIEVPNGARVLDFGQNISGYVRMSFEGVAGKHITLTHGEVLDKDGNFTTQNFRNPALGDIPYQIVDYTCKDGMNEYQPTKTYFGFRYVLVEADFEVEPSYFEAVAIYSDMKVTAEFECGVPEVNQLFKNAIWSMKGNFVDVPTDCPTREKSGYSGDCQAFVNTAMTLMDCYSVYAKWIREAAAGQYDDGAIPQISPKNSAPGQKQKMMGKMDMEAGIGWADAFEIVPYKMMKRYGDDSLIRENYESLKRWTLYEIKRAKKTRLLNKTKLPRKYAKYMIDTGWMWGEWLEPSQTDAVKYMTNLMMHGDPEVGTAFFYQHLVYMKEMAEYLADTLKAEYVDDFAPMDSSIKNEIEKYVRDASEYDALAHKVREAYRAVYTEGGRVTEKERQCRFVRPIVHNLLTEAEKVEAAASLADMIEKNGKHLGTGFLTTHELNRSLSDYGQVERAYDVLLQREAPGFLYAVTKGCTTIPEDWNCFDADGNPHNSFNHYSYGAITGWLIDSVCGIRVNGGQITISPKPDVRLGYASASYDSPIGLIKSSWKYDGHKISYEITVPANNSACIELPGCEAVTVDAGKYIL
ncbi:MAG: glycoside hydrolase family 78 protein [Lachnospiraceae bacterium]|nr:glycoside hydrolase family 78 protein [Lachnospiraceae bacterium]